MSYDLNARPIEQSGKDLKGQRRVWHNVQIRPLVKAAGALVLALLLWQFLVSGVFSQLQSAPLGTSRSQDLVGISIPYQTDTVKLTLTTDAGSNEAYLEIYLLADNVTETPVEPATIVLLGDSVRSLRACGDSEVSIETTVNQEALTPSLKKLVWNHIRKQKQADYEAVGQTGVWPSDQEIADIGSLETYSIIKLEVTPESYQQEEGGVQVQKSRLRLSTTCSLDPAGFWTNQAPDTRLSSPTFAFALSSEIRGSQSAATSVQAGMDYSLLRSTQVPGQNQEGPEMITWNWSPSRWTVDGSWYYSSEDGLSAVFRSATGDRRVQNELFIAGVALGIIGSLVISVFNSITDFAGDALGSMLRFRRGSDLRK